MPTIIAAEDGLEPALFDYKIQEQRLCQVAQSVAPSDQDGRIRPRLRVRPRHSRAPSIMGRASGPGCRRALQPSNFLPAASCSRMRGWPACGQTQACHQVREAQGSAEGQRGRWGTRRRGGAAGSRGRRGRSTCRRTGRRCRTRCVSSAPPARARGRGRRGRARCRWSAACRGSAPTRSFAVSSAYSADVPPITTARWYGGHAAVPSVRSFSSSQGSSVVGLSSALVSWNR